MIKGYDENAMQKRKTPEDRADYYVSYVQPSCYEITINYFGSEILELKKKIMEIEKYIKERQLIISKIQIAKAYEAGKEDTLRKISQIPKIEMTFCDIKESLNNN